jgi:uncharacterized protein (UPF0335 family)
MTDAKLKSYVERIDRLMTTLDETREDIAEVIKEAKGDGYIPKTLRKVATRYHADPQKIATEDALLETYEAALGKVGKALEAIRNGATWEEARKEHNVPRATMARAQTVSKRREVIPEAQVEGTADNETSPAPAAANSKETSDARDEDAGEATRDAGGEGGGEPAPELLDSDGTQRREVGPPCNAGSGSERGGDVERGAPEGAATVRVAPTISVGAEARSAEPVPSLYQRITGAFKDPREDDLAIPGFLRRVPA